MRVEDKRQKTINEGKLFISNLDGDVYVLGTNLYGLSLANWLKNTGFKIKGFINDFYQEELFSGYKVFRSNEKFKDDSIINCIVEGRAFEAFLNIEKMKPKSQVSYFSLKSAFKDQLPEVQFLDNTDSIIDDLDSYTRLYDLLQDDISKNHFEAITNFRLNRDISFLKDFIFNIRGQYFEDFLTLKDNPTFLDGGGFDGYTSILFSKIYPNYNEIFYFEPSLNSYNISQKNLQNLENIHLIQKGLWNYPTTLTFNSSLGSASKISNHGVIFIETTTIDNIGASKIDLIKLDIEGAEKQALIGAKETILRDRPKLAVCVYHNQEDFIEIPKLILGIRNDYKVFLRHYTQGVFETVMYFI